MRATATLVVLLALVSLCASFEIGVNLPWVQYGRDFGTNSWGYAGIASDTSKVNAAFSTAASNHARTIRVWLFSDSRAGIRIDGSGNPTGLDGKVFSDMDAIIQSAKNKGVKVVFVFFDFLLASWYSIVNGVQLGGRTSWITDPNQRAALINNVVVPVLQRYSAETTIAAWEIMNEPEWIVRDLPQPTVDTSKINAVNLDQFYAFASAISSAVHTYSSRPCTLGSATLKWHVIWTDSFATSKGFTPLNLDFYQTHYYSWMDNNPINDPVLGTFNQSPMQQSYSGLNLDKPMVVGEFGAGNDIATVLGTLQSNGYSGAWAWSVYADYTIDSNIWNTIGSWANQHGLAQTVTPEEQQQQQQTTDTKGGDGLTDGDIAGVAISAAAVFLAILFIGALVALLVALVIRRNRRMKAMHSLNYVHMQEEGSL